jgi:single-stranded-DNA-specific exonuclease
MGLDSISVARPSVAAVVNSVLAKRLAPLGVGYDVFDSTAHGLLADVDVACSLLWAARVRGDRVVVLPDYDMDGVMSGVLGFTGLIELGFDTRLFVPAFNRDHAFTAADIDRLFFECAAGARTVTIVTCDTGSSSEAAVRHARERGAQVIVTDHHEGVNVPSANVVVNPCRADDPYPHKGICGAHVLWQVLVRYVETYARYDAVFSCVIRDGDREVSRYELARNNIYDLKTFAGLGTISDVMPLSYENRELVRQSLSVCNRLVNDEGGRWCASHFRTCMRAFEDDRGMFGSAFDGLLTLLDVGVYKSPFGFTLIDVDDIAFTVAPMVNAVRRVGGDFRTMFGVFFPYVFGFSSSESCARLLYDMNSTRKERTRELEAKIAASDMSRYGKHICVLDGAEGAGFVGLIAGHLRERRLADASAIQIVLSRGADGSLRGSARAADWYDGKDAVSRMGGIAGGHQHAFGVTVASDAAAVELGRRLDEDASRVFEHLRAVMPDTVCRFPDLVLVDFGVPGYVGDASFDLVWLSELHSALERFGPFGKGFEPPRFRFVFDARFVSAEAFKSDGKGGFVHGKLTLVSGLSVVAWYRPDVPDEVARVADEFGRGLRSNALMYVDGALGFDRRSASVRTRSDENDDDEREVFDIDENRSLVVKMSAMGACDLESCFDSSFSRSR